MVSLYLVSDNDDCEDDNENDDWQQKRVRHSGSFGGLKVNTFRVFIESHSVKLFSGFSDVRKNMMYFMRDGCDSATPVPLRIRDGTSIIQDKSRYYYLQKRNHHVKVFSVIDLQESL